MNETSRLLRERSFAFALRIVKLVRALESDNRERVLSKQLLKSGTSVGANVREARFAQSTADFVSKLSISLKEGEETAYWLELLNAAGFIPQAEFDSLQQDLDWIIGTLVNVVKANKLKLTSRNQDRPHNQLRPTAAYPTSAAGHIPNPGRRPLNQLRPQAT